MYLLFQPQDKSRLIRSDAGLYDDQESVLFCAAPVEEVESIRKVHVPKYLR